MNTVVTLACLLLLANAANFDISSSSTCTNYTAGFCTKWEQTGTVQEQMGSCFPGNARVIGRDGPIEMQYLRKGDEILGWVGGEERFVKVTSWLHRSPNANDEFLQLNSENGWLQVSAKHNLATNYYEFKFASEVESFFPHGEVDSVSKVINLGKYAPKTSSNNYFVLLEESNNSDKALAHCFAHIRNPELYETPFGLIESLWDMFAPSESSSD
jgi:hypothetical protein